MKKKITDLMDDLPLEELECILSQPERRKRRGLASGMFKVAVAAAVVIIFGGGVALAAYSDSGFLKNHLGFGEQEEEKAATVVKEEQISTENDDYILSVEEFAGDETLQMLLIRVEGKTDESREYLRTHEIAAPVFKTAQGSTDNGYMETVRGREGVIAGLEEGARYYFFTLEEAMGTGTLYFGEGLKKVDVQYETAWFTEHRDEILELDIEVENTVSSSITLHPGEIEDGITFDRIEIGHFSVSGEGTCAESKRMKVVYPIPEITAVYEDGTEVIVIAGNMGYERETDADKALANGYRYNASPYEGEDIRFWSVFDGYLDVEKVKEIQINGESYPIEEK